jgi:hypothetical protein
VAITLGRPDNCLQSLKDLSNHDDDDTDIWLPDATVKYLERPAELENYTNAEFYRRYRVCTAGTRVPAIHQLRLLTARDGSYRCYS